MANCINFKHRDFLKLVDQANIGTVRMAAKVGVWQEKNNSSDFPILKQLGLLTYNPTMLPLKDNESLYEHYKLLNKDGDLKALDFKTATEYADTFNKNVDIPHEFRARQTTDGNYRVLIADIANRDEVIDTFDYEADYNKSDKAKYDEPGLNLNISESSVKPNDREIVDTFVDKLLLKLPNVNEVIWIDSNKLTSILGKDMPLNTNINAFIKGNTAYLVKGRVTADIAIEELLHPFINALKTENKDLYDKLLNEVLTKSEFKDLKKKILNDYKEMSIGYTNSELITQALATVTRSEIENNPKGRTFIDLIKEFYTWMSNLLNGTLDIMSKTVNIKTSDLYKDFTLRDLAKIINTNNIVITAETENKGTSFNLDKTFEDKLKANESKISRGKGGYVNTENGNVLKGVTSKMNDVLGLKIDENIDMTRSSEVGTSIHNYASSIITGDASLQAKSPYKLSEKAHNKLEALINKLTRKTKTVLSEQLLSHNDSNTIGIADLIVETTDGKKIIYDFKTKESGFANYESKLFSEYSDKDKHAIQLSTYRDMAYEITGEGIDEIKTILIQPVIVDNTIVDIKDLSIVTLSINNKYKPILGKNSNSITTDNIIQENTKLNKLEKTIDSAIASYEKMLQELRTKDKIDIIDEKKTKDALAKLRDMDYNKSILEIIKMSNKTISKLYTDYNNSSELERNGEFTFTPQYLYRLLEEMQNFEFLNEIESLTYAIEESSSKELKNEILSSTIRDSIRMRDEIVSAYSKRGLSIVAKFLSKNTKMIEVQYRENIERQYNLLPETERNATTLEQYVDKWIADNKTNIEFETEARIAQELEHASGDISVIARWIDNALDSPDIVIGAVTKAIGRSMYQLRQQSIDKHGELLGKLRNLESSVSDKVGGFKDIKDLYEPLLEKIDGKYTGYLASESYSTLKSDYQQYFEERTKEYEESLLEIKDDESNLRTKIFSKYNPQEFKYFKLGKKNIKQLLEFDYKHDLSKWKTENAPLDKKAYIEAKHTFLGTLNKEGILTNQQLDDIASDAKLAVPEIWEQYYEDGMISEEAFRSINHWIYTNTWKYRRPIAKYTNKDFAKIKALPDNSPLKDIYKLFVEMAEEADQMLPPIKRLGLRLPGIEKTAAEVLQAGGTVKDAISRKFEDFMTYRPDDINRNNNKVTINGNTKKYLPIHYVGKIDQDVQSYDLATIYFKYWYMANDYKTKLTILPEVEMTRHFVNNRDLLKKNNKGELLYKLNTLMKDKVEAYDSSKKINATEQFNDWVDAIFYGEKDTDLGTFRMFGKVFDKAKSIDALANYTSLNFLGVNFIQGISNVLFGEAMQKIDAITGQYISIGSLSKASYIYDRELVNGALISDVGNRKPKTFINLLNEKFDTLNEAVGHPAMRKSNKVRNLMNQSTLFFTSHAGEHWMQSRLLVGMLNERKAMDKDGKVIKDSKGKELTILDLYKAENGKLKFDNMNGQVANWTQDDEFNFQNKFKGIATRLHGQYNELEWAAIQKHALTRLVYQFRKFVMPGFKRRFFKAAYNNRLEENIEGSYLTFGRFIKKFTTEALSFKMALATEEWTKLTKMEKANVIRTSSEIAFVATLTGLIALLKGLKDDDDDDTNKYLYGSSMYLAARLRSEMLFYIDWNSSYQMLRSPATALGLVDSAFKLLKQSFNPTEEYNRGTLKGDLKIYHRAAELMPLLRQVYKVETLPERFGFYDW